MCVTHAFSPPAPTRQPTAACCGLLMSGLGCGSYGLLSHEVFVTGVILALIPHVSVVTWSAEVHAVDIHTGVSLRRQH